MSGKREPGISYNPTVMLNAVNDAVCGGSVNKGTGATLYGGLAGIEVELTDSQVMYDTSGTITKLYGGRYKYVQFLSTGGTAVAGQIVFWSDPDNYVVTCTNGGVTSGDGNQAGVALNEVTAGNWGWIQVRGIANVLFDEELAQATPAAKDYVVVATGENTADAIADGTTITASLLKNMLGIAKQAPVAGTIKLVELLDRFASPFA